MTNIEKISKIKEIEELKRESYANAISKCRKESIAKTCFETSNAVSNCGTRGIFMEENGNITLGATTTKKLIEECIIPIFKIANVNPVIIHNWQEKAKKVSKVKKYRLDLSECLAKVNIIIRRETLYNNKKDKSDVDYLIIALNYIANTYKLKKITALYNKEIKMIKPKSI